MRPASGQLAGAGPHHVREHARVSGTALRAGHAVPLPVPGRLQRVHREHGVADRDQRGHPRAVVGLDPDDHLRPVRVLAQMPADQLAYLRDPGDALRQPPFRHGLPSLVHHFHVVMVLCASHLLRTAASILPSAMSKHVNSQRENHPRPNETVLTPPGGHDTQQQSILPVTGRGTVFLQGSKPGKAECSPAGGHHTRSLPDGRLPETH